MRLVEIALFVGTLRSPDDTGRGSSWVEAGVRFVAFVAFAELAVDGRVEF
jgi:hypothetical protein